MDLLSIGSASQYAKTQGLKTRWNLKKQSGDFTGHKKSLQDYVNFTKASSVLPDTDETDHKMSGIMTKAQAGRKLSYDEWEYLRAKNPALYEKLKEAEREQEAYEKELRRCKTRDEARRLHMSKLGEILSAAKNGDESALFRLNRLTRTMTDFTASEDYHKLPTETEEAMERKAEAQSEEPLSGTRDREATEREPLSGTRDREATEREPLSGTADGEKVKTDSGVETSVKAPRRAGTETRSAAPERTNGKVSSNDVPLSFGRREYMNRRDEKPRRREFNAKA